MTKKPLVIVGSIIGIGIVGLTAYLIIKNIQNRSKEKELKK